MVNSSLDQSGQPLRADYNHLSLMAAAFDRQGMAVCLYDRDDKVVTWNDAYLSIFPEEADIMSLGLPYAEALRRFYEVHLPPAELPFLERHMSSGLERHATQVDPYVYQRRDGRWIKAEILRDSTGNALKLWTDVTDDRSAPAGWPDLKDSFASTDVAFALFDGTGRFVSANQAYTRLFPGCEPLADAEHHYSDHLRWQIEQVVDPLEHDRLRPLLRHGNHVGSSAELTLRRRDSGWLNLQVRPTRSGGFILFWVDVTDRIEALEQAATLQQRLSDAIDSLAEGVALYDKDDRLLVCNDRYRQINRPIQHLIQPGAAWIELLCAGVEHGLFGDQAAAEGEAWITAQQLKRRSAVPSYDVPLAHGHWLRCTDRRTREGGTISIASDITDLKRREAELARQAAMLGAIGYAATHTLSRGDLSEAVTLLLSKLGAVAGASRVLVLQHETQEDGQSTWGPRFEWCAADIASTMNTSHFQNSPLARDDPVLRDRERRLRGGKVVQLRVAELDGALAEVLQAQRVIASISAPIMVRDQYWGTVDFHDCICEVGWSEVDSEVLKTTAALLAAIFERTRMDNELGDSEQRFRTIAESIPVMINAAGKHGQVLYASPLTAELLGLPLSTVYRRLPTDFFANADQQSGFLRELKTAGKVENFEVTLNREGSGDLPVAATSKSITYDGSPAYVSVLFDLTERKSAEAELARRGEALHQAEKLSALGTLLAGVAHELNNPLTIVAGQAHLMEQLSTDPTTSGRAHKIRTAAERCARIVKTFLAMARQQPAEHTPVDLNGAVEAALELTAYAFSSNGIEVVCELATDLPPVWGVRDQLSQVLLNLIVNAQQALLEVNGPRRLGVRSQYSEAERQVQIEISDNGPGIPENIRQRIFEPYFTTKPVGTGTGIGLPISHGIVTAHGGSIGVSSSADGGARFRITLPVDSAQRAAAGADKQAATAGAGGRVLIVDDEPEVAEILADILAAVGHRITIVNSGRQALDVLNEQPFDAVLSDLRMPELDGPGLYQALLKKRSPLARRIAFVTGDSLRGLGARRQESDVPVIEKPFDADEVRQTVTKLLDSG